jgi:pyruvate dehydrogenase E2 component (dihydrolipoamide acetyltransferase)
MPTDDHRNWRKIQEIQETQNPIENKPAEPKLTENKPSENKSVNKSVNKIITVPDIGTDAAVKVIEVNVKIGDSIAAEDTLITLESEKASMEIPAPSAGIVKNIEVKVGDSVKTGSVILGLEVIEQLIDKPAEKSAEKTPEKKSEQSTEKPIEKFIEKPQPAAVAASNLGSSLSYASPSVRRFAKELGVNLTKVQGTGRKGRLVKQDIEQYIKTQLSKLESGTGTQANAVNLPVIDFSKFGEVSTKPLTRIQKLSANNLQRNWTMIPHVTQFDEADITDLESFRQKYKDQAESKGYKLTPLVFLLKAAAQVLKALPKFNVSLTNDGENFIQKYYYHIF